MLDALLGPLRAQLDNEFFTGGLALGFIGVLAALGRAAWPAGRILVLRWFAVRVSINSRRPVYRQLVAWLHAHPYAHRCRRLMVDQAVRSDDNEVGRVLFTPAPGRHMLRHQGVLLWFEREVADRASGGRGAVPRETVTITAFTRQVSFLRSLMTEVEAFEPDADGRMKVYELDSFEDWSVTARIAKRPLSTVVVPDEIDKRLLADARRFLGGAEWYRTRGVPWRRGYLLHGPPGTGKTSLVRAIAGELGLDLAVIGLASGKLDDSGLTAALASAPPRTALVLEDVDAAFSGRQRGEGQGRLTFSGLLNAIDGVASQEGHLLFMTTNHPECLDPALVRPGRIDLSLEVGLAGPKEAERLFLLFFPGETERAAEFAAGLEGERISSAEIQAKLVAWADGPEPAIKW